MYVIGPRPPLEAERVDLVPYVRAGLVYREASLPVWRVEAPWPSDRLREKLAARGFRVSQWYIPPSVMRYLRGEAKAEAIGEFAAVYVQGETYWIAGGERGRGGCPDVEYVAVWGQRVGCGGFVIDLSLVYRRHLWLEAAERLGDGWLLKAMRRGPWDAAEAVYALAREAVAFLNALVYATGVGVDAILQLVERNTVAALAEAVFHREAERRGVVFEDGRRAFDMPYMDLARGRAPGVYRRVAELDFKSLFPSVVATHGVDPLTARPCRGGMGAEPLGEWCFDGGPVSDVVRKWLERRAEARDKAEAEALKWLMNAGIGAWGKAGWGLICEPCLLAVRRFAERLFNEAWRRFDPIYGDTDSLYVEEHKAGEALEWAKSLRGLRLELRGVWSRFILVPAKSGGVAEKNYVKIGDEAAVKGGLLRPHDLPLAVRLRYQEVVREAAECGDPVAKAVEIVKEAPAEQLYVYKAVEAERLRELRREYALHRAARFFAEACPRCGVLDVFYLPAGDVVYVPGYALTAHAARPAAEWEVRHAAVEYVRRLWKLRALAEACSARTYF